MIHENATTITRNVDMNLDAVENILISTAKRCLKIKTAKKRRWKISSNKKWFDKECRHKRHELRKLSNQKHTDPLNNSLREEYHNVLSNIKTFWNIRETNTIAIRSVNLKIRSKIRTIRAFGTVWSQWTTLWRKPTPLQFLKKNGCPTFNFCTRMNPLMNSRRQLLMSCRIQRILQHDLTPWITLGLLLYVFVTGFRRAYKRRGLHSKQAIVLLIKIRFEGLL